MKGVIVAVVGRASSGKSTFINTVTENKVSFVSPVPQSTRAVTRGMYEDSRGQMVFSDTPGLHIGGGAFNSRLTASAIRAIRESDAVLYVLDANDKPGEEEKRIAFYADTSGKPVVAFINKCDVADKKAIDESREFVLLNVGSAMIFEGSALCDTGIDDVLRELFRHSSERPGPLMEHWTDATLEFRLEEAVLEQIFLRTKEEVPHSCMVRVSEISERDGKVTVRAFIYCERDSQKRIIIGAGGANIKAIRVGAQRSMRRIFTGRSAELFLTVKIDSKWKKNAALLDGAGY